MPSLLFYHWNRKKTGKKKNQMLLISCHLSLASHANTSPAVDSSNEINWFMNMPAYYSKNQLNWRVGCFLVMATLSCKQINVNRHGNHTGWNDAPHISELWPATVSISPGKKAMSIFEQARIASPAVLVLVFGEENCLFLFPKCMFFSRLKLSDSIVCHYGLYFTSRWNRLCRWKIQ